MHVPAGAIHEPVPAPSYHVPMVPALVFGAGGAGTNSGTYLVGYSGLSDGTDEFQVGQC